MVRAPVFPIRDALEDCSLGLAHATRVLYGLRMGFGEKADGRITLDCTRPTVTAVDVELQVRWNGHALVVQISDASWWGTLPFEWAHEIPEPLLRAALIDTAPGWWKAFEAHVGPIEIRGVRANPPPLSPSQALGVMLRSRRAEGATQTWVLVSDTDGSGLVTLANRFAKLARARPATCDAIIEITVALPLIGMRPSEIGGLEPGDLVLVGDLAGEDGRAPRLAVELRVGARSLYTFAIDGDDLACIMPATRRAEQHRGARADEHAKH